MLKKMILGGGFKYIFIFTPIPGEMIQFDGQQIFPLGWFNHQLDCILFPQIHFLQTQSVIGQV